MYWHQWVLFAFLGSHDYASGILGCLATLNKAVIGRFTHGCFVTTFFEDCKAIVSC